MFWTQFILDFISLDAYFKISIEPMVKIVTKKDVGSSLLLQDCGIFGTMLILFY